MAELATIRHLLAEASPVTEDEITPEKHLVKDLELDSFSLLDTVSVFEKEFSISIPVSYTHLEVYKRQPHY